jgi:uncharacterized repeat protein (TIGR04076 family)
VLAKLRITVLKKMHFPDLQASYAKDGTFGICTAFEEGQVFETVESKPDGFCSWAWADIQRDITNVRFGGANDWLRHRGTWLSSCTDGLKPVIFLLERMPNGRRREGEA